ncbi:MAG TPA: hypothetical protein VF461_19890 [Gemmatimonadaceae bacterium]
MSLLERVVGFVAAQYRWGLHPLKLIVALTAPVLIVYLADRRVRQIAATVAAEEERVRRLPRMRRR